MIGEYIVVYDTLFYFSILITVIGIFSLFYNVASFICLEQLNKQIKQGNKEEALNKGSKGLIFIAIVQKALKNTGNKTIIKELISKLKLFSLFGTAISLIISILFTSLSVVFYNMNLQMLTTATFTNTLFGDKDCICYVKCSGESADDVYSTYELLFGEDEFNNFCDSLELNPLDKEKLDSLIKKKEEFIKENKDASTSEESVNTGADASDIDEDNENNTNESTDTDTQEDTTNENEEEESKNTSSSTSIGKQLNDFLASHINDEAIQEYKSLVANSSGFMLQADGKDRSQMSDDELKTDLLSLFKDYKVNGRNPNCKACKSASQNTLLTSCRGMAKWKKGWSWKSLWDSTTIFEEEQNNSGGGSNTPGHAKGNFAVQLNDGTYYWYHQSQEDCANNAKDDTFGLLGKLYAGSVAQGTMSARGCGIYSTAMALSNLLDEEITPYVVIQKVMGCTIKSDSRGNYYFESHAENGLQYTGTNATIHMSTLADRINEAYKDEGVIAEVIEFNKANVDKYLDNDEMYAYIINSWGGSGGSSSFPWYKGNGHFMVMRNKSEDGKYQCFTSASTLYGFGHENIIKGMNAGAEWSAVNAYKRHSEAIVIHRDKSLYNQGGTVEGVGYNEEVYNILLNTGYASKALALAMVYGLLEPTYGKAFAIGVMANVWSEGEPGVVEFYFSQTHHYGFYLPSGDSGRIKSMEDIDYLLAWPSVYEPGNKKNSCGVGSIQWSYEWRIDVVSKYKELCANFKPEDYTTENFMAVDMQVIKQHMDANAKDIITKTEAARAANDASQCAYLFCTVYEQPGNARAKGAERSVTANDLVSILANVKTSGITVLLNGEDTTQDTNNNNTSQDSKGQQVVDYAVQWKGNHYVWGGTTLGCTTWGDSIGIDCSGFTMKVFEQFGVSLPHQSGQQRSCGIAVDFSNVNNLLPGDLICYEGHVAIYIGNGQIVHAKGAAYGVVVGDRWDYKTVITVRRLV